MKPSGPDFIDLAGASAANLKQGLAALHGYSKFSSILWIRALGEPTLDGIIVRRWSAGTAKALRAFCIRHNCKEFLVRTDTHLRRWSRRRGGYLVSAEAAKVVVSDILSERAVAAMLEPLSPYRDLYCLTCLAIPEERRLVVEVVGPGFDTSDLLRSDLLPHERFDVLTLGETSPLMRPADIALKRTYVIDDEEYLKSVEARVTKIGARLRDPAFPEKVVRDNRKLSREAVEFLKAKEPFILRHAEHYEPIPRSLLLRFSLGVLRMLGHLTRLGLHLGSVSFSGTFTARKRLVYWDFFPADIKKTHLLYSFRS